MAKKRWRLPALDKILEAVPPRSASDSVQSQRQIIEKTLADFGYPVQVDSMYEGPMVTQFSLTPGPETQLSKIKSLDVDLALALDGLPVQVEEPSPDHPRMRLIVGRARTRLVRLREVLETSAFRQSDATLKVGLGIDSFGQPVVIDLTEMPHLLIGGTTGAGKSVCINAMLTGLLCTYTPTELQLLLIDPAQVELKQYSGLPHLLAPVVTDSEVVVEMLQTSNKEINRRFTEFSKLGVRDLSAYNRRAPHVGRQRYPYLLIVIDNLIDLMLRHPTKVENALTRIAAMGRGAGVHLIFATQRSNVDIVAGAIKANAAGRIAFRVTSNTDSRLILDASGAEDLLNEGELLYRAPNTNQTRRVQGAYVSDVEIERLVAFWRGQ